MKNMLAAAAVVLAAVSVTAQNYAPSPDLEALHVPYDALLDLHVRDGLVYYRALQGDRAKLNRYVASLNSPSVVSGYAQWSSDQKKAFWLNAYNALVLKTVIDRYPIAGKSPEYPSVSIRQLAGAFERTAHRVAGRSLTLDQIEQTVLPEFGDPRVFLALGRGAVGSGRLRSEAYAADRVDAQLADVAAECLRRTQCVQVDRNNNRVLASSIFSWRSNEFVAALAGRANPRFAARSPIERAILALVVPGLLSAERTLIEQNTFAVQFVPFDWTLNDLTGR